MKNDIKYITKQIMERKGEIIGMICFIGSFVLLCLVTEHENKASDKAKEAYNKKVQLEKEEIAKIDAEYAKQTPDTLYVVGVSHEKNGTVYAVDKDGKEYHLPLVGENDVFAGTERNDTITVRKRLRYKKPFGSRDYDRSDCEELYMEHVENFAKTRLISKYTQNQR